MLENTIYKKRIERVLEYLVEKDCNFALITPSPTFQYLTGIQREMRERLIALVLQPEASPRIIAPAFEVTNLSNESWIKEFIPWAEDEDPYTVLAESIDTTKELVPGFDNSLPMGIYWSLEKALGPFSSAFSISPFVNEMRIVKSEEELDLMRKAGRIIADAVMKAFSFAKLGMTEIELKHIVTNEITQAGATPTFAAVQFGENSALPHHEGGIRELRRNDVVLMDCGCAVGGYNTDMTRVGVVGEPTDELETVYATVLNAEETAIDRIQDGLACGKADGIARKIIEEANYGDYFTHRLGHGIGLEVHEPPYLVRGNAMQLKTGMTHSVEPGIYLLDKFGIRIEDLVCVKEDEAEVLTYAPKDLFVIEVE
ncbi:MAG: M24 family metallopeptidase [Candidatus Lokiarchaeota archaeon]|nr:M24 family metallopeptidase [Candidatus Lokiarchaeota archaeon]